jgi:hypothetical protein
MVVLTHSDARVYCLGIAQLIPVFVIAISVVENNTAKKKAKRAKLASIRSELRGGKGPSAKKKSRQKLERSIERLDGRLAEVDSIDLSQASEEAIVAHEMARIELIESRVEAQKLLDEASTTAKGWSEELGEWLVLAQERGEVAALTEINAYALVYAMFSGIVGEIIALWGAIGLMSGTDSIAWSTFIAITIAGILTVFAADRLTITSNLGLLSRGLQAIWVLVTAGIAFLTFLLVISNVKVIG